MTVRTLVLLRHAKAERPDRGPDSERRLTARGHADSAAAGAWLKSRHLRPELVLCSPSRRTRETWHGVALALGDEADDTRVNYEPALYDSGARRLLDLIDAIDPTVEVLMVIGHNPSISMLSTLLDPDSEIDDGLRTAGIAVHRVDGTWAECGPGKAPVTATYTARAS
jgi:phosphohistidine phosphatase